ncbi:MAG: XdhC family protein [Polyangiaceae bacterium]
MSDTREIVRATASLRAEGRAYLIATVVAVEGSSYRKPGARMIVTEDGWVAGSVSGGCLERDVVRRGAWLADAARAIAYDATEDGEIARTLGCGGVVHVLVEHGGGAADPTAFMEECVGAQERGAIATVFRVRSDAPDAPRVGARVLRRAGGPPRASGLDGAIRSACARACEVALEAGKPEVVRIACDGGEADVLVEVITPPTRLFLFGAGRDAKPVASLARELGWEVTVEGGPARAVRDRIDRSHRAACVVMNHHVEKDRDALATALDSRAEYVGALGPRPRTERLLAELGRADAMADPRLHAPVGLAIGAETPAEVALSIVSEIQADLRCAPGGSLRARSDRIHVER